MIQSAHGIPRNPLLDVEWEWKPTQHPRPESVKVAIDEEGKRSTETDKDLETGVWDTTD